MKKSELKQIIKEEIIKVLSEDMMSSMQLISNLTPQIKQTIEDLKLKYPKHNISITSNDKWRPDDASLKGTYTLSVSGPPDDQLESEIKDIE